MNKNYLIMSIFFLPFKIFSFAILFNYVNGAYEYSQSSNWIELNGYIINNEGFSGGKSYKVTYGYSMDGSVYVGDRVSFMGNRLYCKPHNRFIGNAGDNVIVYVNNNNHSSSVLFKYISWQDLYLMPFGVLIGLLFGLIPELTLLYKESKVY